MTNINNWEVCEKIVNNTLNLIIEEKGNEIIWPRIKDYIHNILSIACENWLDSIWDIVNYMSSKNHDELQKLINNSNNIIVNKWFENTYFKISDNENSEITTFLTAMRSFIDDKFKTTIYSYVVWYTKWYIEWIINWEDSCENKIKNIQSFLNDL